MVYSVAAVVVFDLSRPPTFDAVLKVCDSRTVPHSFSLCIFVYQYVCIMNREIGKERVDKRVYHMSNVYVVDARGRPHVKGLDSARILEGARGWKTEGNRVFNDVVY